MKKLLRKRYPAICWTIVTFVLLALPGSMLPEEQGFTIPEFDKLVHAGLFGGFTFLWAYYRVGRPDNRYSVSLLGLIYFLLSCAFGTAMEYLQKYVIPRRDFDLWDILADCVGAAIGYLVFLLVMRFARRASA